jgi:hypothetical protein
VAFGSIFFDLLEQLRADVLSPNKRYLQREGPGCFPAQDSHTPDTGNALIEDQRLLPSNPLFHQAAGPLTTEITSLDRFLPTSIDFP